MREKSTLFILIVMLKDLIFRIQGISLRWKLLIPFLFFSFTGTTALVYVGLTSQQDLIRKEERKEILDAYRHFLTRIRHKGDQALSIATIIAGDPRVQALLAEEDLHALYEYTLPMYERLRRDFGIEQFHFHTPPGKSFLRVHATEIQGEMISYRKTIMDVMKSGRGIASLEWGVTGLGMRGVVPVRYGGSLVGSFEIGYPFDRAFLEDVKRSCNLELTVYERSGKVYNLLSTTAEEIKGSCPAAHLKGQVPDSPVISISPADHPACCILVGPIKDYFGEVVAVVEMNAGRGSIVGRLSVTKKVMILVGLAGIIISFALIWAVATLFTRPIEEIVAKAGEIAEGRRDVRLGIRPQDEIGLLTRSLNTMLDALKEREREIEDHARTLETRVRERTADLVASEEKYRALVENLPLIVYRILNDGSAEFINTHLTEKLGYSIDEVVGDRSFWREKIWRCSRKEAREILKSLEENDQGFRVERVVKDREGRRLIFMDRAIPFKDERGRLRWIEGIMMDITELKRLQEAALRREEINILGEISARFAHEMRNPLTSAGGFARRLRDSLPQGEKTREFAEIIVEEVTRLEHILKIILSSIEPFDISPSEVDLNRLLGSVIKGLEDQMEARSVEGVVSLSPSVKGAMVDEDLLKKALGALLKHTVLTMPRGERLFVSTEMENANPVVTIRYVAPALSDDDLEQFFFPRFTGEAAATVHDLPLSKIIVHRHGGKIDLFRHGKELVLRVELPPALPVA
ncbi:MAG: PAS domain S-box protein [Deltaproteobacteria bacterium]|nr:PAS domain S-box protein [Deltaproteobacteria bacterium]